MVAMPDADIDGAAEVPMDAAYGSAGERCMAICVALPGVADSRPFLRLAPPHDDA